MQDLQANYNKLTKDSQHFSWLYMPLLLSGILIFKASEVFTKYLKKQDKIENKKMDYSVGYHSGVALVSRKLQLKKRGSCAFFGTEIRRINFNMKQKAQKYERFPGGLRKQSLFCIFSCKERRATGNYKMGKGKCDGKFI